MNQFVAETKIRRGSLKLENVPMSDNTEVKVIVIPKFDLKKTSFRKARKLARGIKGNLADDIVAERNGK